MINKSIKYSPKLEAFEIREQIPPSPRSAEWQALTGLGHGGGGSGEGPPRFLACCECLHWDAEEAAAGSRRSGGCEFRITIVANNWVFF